MNKEELFAKIKIDYEMSGSELSNRALAVRYGIDEKTIRNKVKQEGWKKGALRNKVVGIKEDLDVIRNEYPQAAEYLNDKLSETLDIKQITTDIATLAIKLNLKNIQDIYNMEDPQERIKYTSMAKLNMADLAGTFVAVKNATETEANEDKVINLIIE